MAANIVRSQVKCATPLQLMSRVIEGLYLLLPLLLPFLLSSPSIICSSILT
jgi:hypothetical protein